MRRKTAPKAPPKPEPAADPMNAQVDQLAKRVAELEQDVAGLKRILSANLNVTFD